MESKVEYPAGDNQSYQTCGQEALHQQRVGLVDYL